MVSGLWPPESVRTLDVGPLTAPEPSLAVGPLVAGSQDKMAPSKTPPWTPILEMCDMQVHRSMPSWDVPVASPERCSSVRVNCFVGLPRVGCWCAFVVVDMRPGNCYRGMVSFASFGWNQICIFGGAFGSDLGPSRMQYDGGVDGCLVYLVGFVLIRRRRIQGREQSVPERVAYRKRSTGWKKKKKDLLLESRLPARWNCKFQILALVFEGSKIKQSKSPLC